MKKVQITLFLIVMIVITIFACGCSQDTSEFDYSTPDIAELPPYTVFTDGDYTYNVYSDHAELVGYTGKSTTGKIAEKAEDVRERLADGKEKVAKEFAKRKEEIAAKFKKEEDK